jgi:hypothetical protein
MASAIVLPPVSNREDWDEQLEIVGRDGAPLNLDGVTALTLTVWDPDTRATMLSGAIGSGLAIENSEGGIIAIHFGADAMSAFAAKNYAFRLGMTSGGATKDLILPGMLPVEDGGP